MALTFKEVAEILKIIDASQAEEVVVEVEGTRLVVRRGGEKSVTSAGDMPENPPDRATSEAPQAVRAQRPAEQLEPAHTGVRAPMVGTFFSQPDPDKPPFVEVGARVEKGDPLCLIEVMKLYTTIESPTGGVIESIAVENAAIVEFDQLLFIIKPG